MAQMPDLNVVCKNCGNEVSPYITECPYCGNRLRKRAPKIERDGTVSEPRKARKAPQARRAARSRASAPARSPASAATSPRAPTRRSRWSSSRCSATCCSSRSPLVDVGVAAADRRRVVARGDLALPLREHLVRAGRGHRDRGLRLAARAPPRAARGARPLRAVRDGRHRAGRGGRSARRWRSAATARRSGCCARGPSRTSSRAAAARSTRATCWARRSSPRCCCSCRWRSWTRARSPASRAARRGCWSAWLLARARIA